MTYRLFSMAAIFCSTVSASVAGQGILQITAGNGAARWGSSIAEVGDVDGDGASDLIIGAPGDAGEASVISVKQGVTIFTLTGTSPDEEFGSAVTGLGDVDGDGIVDFAVALRSAIRARSTAAASASTRGETRPSSPP
jgi:hypothetical protein